jgi:hypothetical protein
MLFESVATAGASAILLNGNHHGVIPKARHPSLMPGIHRIDNGGGTVQPRLAPARLPMTAAVAASWVSEAVGLAAGVRLRKETEPRSSSEKLLQAASKKNIRIIFISIGIIP